MSSSSTNLPTPEGPGSVSGAPNLPDRFTDTFTSHYIDTGELRQHAVIGGDGPPLLLVHGWPENWYAWRLLMPQLARDFEVIAPDQRGIGLTDKPRDGYDTGTLANDLVALMDALGHERFAVVGHDTGLIISYALAADHPDRVDRLAVVEVPGPLGVGPSPPLFGLPEPINNKLWHLAFNRVNDEMTEQLVRGREDIFFGYEFAIQGGQKGLPDEVQRYYFDLYSDPDVLRGSFGLYRALDTTLAQNAERKNRPLTMPVLAIGAAESWGEEAGNGIKPAADDVQSVVIPGAGHWVAEQAPQGDAGGADRVPGPVPRGRRWLAMSLFGAHREAGTEILPSEGRLPPFEGATGWLNSESLTPEGLRGRVVAVQFWTYTCVNWLRTLPYVREWDDKYGRHGLTVVGVHTPEFGFERNVDNVVAAAREMRVDYPIALDSSYAVWRAFANHFWPALYIADEQGRIRYHHFGEGEYAMSEMVVQRLLGEAGKEGFDPALVSVEPQGTEVAAGWRELGKPETKPC